MRQAVVDQLRRARHDLANRVRAAAVFARHGWPTVVIRFYGGVGDTLLCTTIFHELRRRGGQKLWMASHYADLFRGNPDVDLVVSPVNPYLEWKHDSQPRDVLANYSALDGDRDILPPLHILGIMCQKAGISGEITLRPYLHLTPAELQGGQRVERQITIQTSSMTAGSAMRNKQWYADRFQAVVNALRGEYNFVQIGALTDPPMEHALDLRGKTKLRETAAVLAKSVLLLGLVSFPMHLARAVNCRSVIIYGGRETPDMTGYSANENLYSAIECSPCWLRNTCPYNLRCMDVISAEMVIEAIRRQAARHGQPLVEDKLIVPALSPIGAK